MPRVLRKGHKERGEVRVTDMSPSELAGEISYWRSQVETATPFKKLLRTHACKVEMGRRFQADVAGCSAAVILKRWGRILDANYIQKALEKSQKRS
jgi:hypothetical protein